VNCEVAFTLASSLLGLPKILSGSNVLETDEQCMLLYLGFIFIFADPRHKNKVTLGNIYLKSFRKIDFYTKIEVIGNNQMENIYFLYHMPFVLFFTKEILFARENILKCSPNQSLAL
jgi:hypothetical protein